MSSRARPFAMLLGACVAVAARAEDPKPPLSPLALLAEGTISAQSAEGDVVAGGLRASLRFGPVSLSGSFDAPLRSSTAPVSASWLALAGLGVVRDLTPDLTLNGAAVAGFQVFRLRDFVHGGSREVDEQAAGGRVGIEWRPGGAGWLHQIGVAPVLGASATVVYAASGSDRLRAVEWGGAAALASLSLGLEFTAPARVPHPPP